MNKNAQKPSDFFDWPLLQQWSDFLLMLRLRFRGAGFFEAHTPTLTPASGTEPSIEPFLTQKSSSGFVHYLPTSPEFALKKLLSRGCGDVFEIRPCFRDEPESRHHLPEFHMLEWYRVGWSLLDLVQDLEMIFTACAEEGYLKTSPEFRVVSVQEVVEQTTGFHLTPATDGHDFPSPHADASFSDAFWSLFLNEVEPSLDPGQATVIYDFPPALAAYAKISQHGWAERFELYFAGFELANAYHEVTDADEQERRLKQDSLLSSKKNPVPIDQELITALKSGFPACSGIALGVERLFMACTGLNDISVLNPLLSLNQRNHRRLD